MLLHTRVENLSVLGLKVINQACSYTALNRDDNQSHTCAGSSSVETGPSGLSALSAVVPGLVKGMQLDFGRCWGQN